MFFSGVLSKKLKAKTFAEPGTDRFLASVINEPKENIKGISYFVESKSHNISKRRFIYS